MPQYDFSPQPLPPANERKRGITHRQPQPRIRKYFDYVIVSQEDPSYELRIFRAQLIKARTYSEVSNIIYHISSGGGGGGDDPWWYCIAKELVDELYKSGYPHDKVDRIISYICFLEIKSYAGIAPPPNLTPEDKLTVVYAMKCINAHKDEPDMIKLKVKDAIREIEEGVRRFFLGDE